MAVQTQHDGLITTAWILGLIIAALGWIPAILSFVTLGLGVLIFTPLYLVALVLAIIGMTRSDSSPEDKSRALQALLMTLTGSIIGWFAFLFLLIRMR